MTSWRRSTISRPRRWAVSRCTISDSASTRSLLIRISSLTRSPGHEAGELVVERGVAAAEGLQPVEEVEDDLGHRDLVFHDHLVREILDALLDAALADAQLHDRPDEFVRHQDARRDVGLPHLGDLVRRRQRGRIVDHPRLALGRDDLEYDRRRRRNEVQAVLALQSLLHDLHVQQAEKPAAESETRAPPRTPPRSAAQRH